MQIYATSQDMIDTFGEAEVIRLTATYEEPSLVDTETLNRALERSSIDIDAYLSSRYPRPFAAIPRVLIGICCDLARYRLCGTGGRVESDEVRDRHRDAIKLLGMIADGKVKLGQDVADEPVDWGQGVQRITGDSSFSDVLKDY